MLGECKMQTPRTRPIKNPPMWEKLSSPGKRPKANEMTMSTHIQSRSLPGDRRSFQVYSKSKRVMAMIPKSAPEAPVEAMPGGAKLPPITKPNIPELR